MFRTLIKNAARDVVDAWKDKLIVDLGGFTRAHHEAVYETLAEHIDTLRAERAAAIERKKAAERESARLSSLIAEMKRDGEQTLALLKARIEDTMRLEAELASRPTSVLHVVEAKRDGVWIVWSGGKSADDAAKGAQALFACNPDREARSVEYWRADHTAKKAGA